MTAPFSATIACSGQAAAKGRLQPIGRPVTAITGTPASASACSASSASGSIAPSRVSVSSISVSTPAMPAQVAGGALASGRGRMGGAVVVMSSVWHDGG